MAVQRVSPLPPSPLPVADEEWSVKSGYLWTLDDPPGALPPEYVRHPAVTEVRAHVTLSVTYSRDSYRYSGYTVPAVSGSAVFGPVDMGPDDGSDYGFVLESADGSDSAPLTLEVNEKYRPDGSFQYSAFHFTREATRYLAPGLGADGVTARLVTAFTDSVPVNHDLRKLQEGAPYTVVLSGDNNTVVTIVASNSPETVELEPARTDRDMPPVKEIAYLGDYSQNLVNRDGRPFGPFASPSRGAPLRGEALAYLMSGFERVRQSVSWYFGLMWLGPDGKVNAANRYWHRSLTASPSLDLFRLRALDFEYVRRAPVPGIAGPPGGWRPAVVLEAGYDTASGTSADLATDFPGWGSNYAVCSSQAEVDAHGGNWMYVDGTGASAIPPYEGLYGWDWRALCLFAALNASAQAADPWPQPVPCPLKPGDGEPGGFAHGYSPPSGDGPASQDPGEGPRAADVAALLARPSGDPARWTRAWRVDGAVDAALSWDAAESGYQFTYSAWATRRVDYAASCYSAADPDVAGGRAFSAVEDEWYAKFEPGGDWWQYNPHSSEQETDPYKTNLYALQIEYGDGTVQDLPWSSLSDVLRHGVWPEEHPGGGDVVFAGKLAASYLTPTSGFGSLPTWSRPGAVGTLWLLGAYYEDRSDSYVPYTTLDRTNPSGRAVVGDGKGPFPVPMNYQDDNTAFPYYKAVPGVTSDGFFGLPYRCSPSDPRADANGVPRTTSGNTVPASPMSLCEVPLESPDDVAFMPLATAFVEYGRNEVCKGAVLNAGTTGVRRTVYREWAACMPVSGQSGPLYGRWARAAGSEYGTYSGPGDMIPGASPAAFASFVGDVLSAVSSHETVAGRRAPLPDPTQSPETMLDGASTWSWGATGNVYRVVLYDPDHMYDAGYAPAVVRTYPQMEVVTSGNAADEVHLRVRVKFRHGLFESGYCA